MNTAMKALEEEVISKAIKLIDTDALAKKMSKKLEKEIIEAYEHQINDIDISYWIKEEIESNKTVAGKAFNKVISKLARTMVDSIGTEGSE